MNVIIPVQKIMMSNNNQFLFPKKSISLFSFKKNDCQFPIYKRY